MIIDMWMVGIGSLMVIGGIIWMLRNMDSNTAIMVTSVGVLLIFASSAFAHDHNKPFLNDWFKSLKAGGVPCCDGSDATRLDDVDWETRDGHYRVRLEGEWYDVPDDAVIKQPNLAGPTMVWPVIINELNGGRKYYIRCFMPGVMT